MNQDAIDDIQFLIVKVMIGLGFDPNVITAKLPKSLIEFPKISQNDFICTNHSQECDCKHRTDIKMIPAENLLLMLLHSFPRIHTVIFSFKQKCTRQL